MDRGLQPGVEMLPDSECWRRWQLLMAELNDSQSRTLYNFDVNIQSDLAAKGRLRVL